MNIKQLLVFTVSSALSSMAYADAFLTGDTDTVPCREWEFELSGTLESAKGSPNEQAGSFEVKYGLLNNLDVGAALSYGWIGKGEGAPAIYGVGDSEFGFDYRLFDQTPYFPALAFSPTLMIPTGESENDLGNGKMWVELPLWLEKSGENWSTAFGGGYGINSQAQRKNFPFAGWKVNYDFTPRLNAGAEVFYQGADSVENEDTLLINIGGDYALTECLTLALSVGHSINGEPLTMAYLGLSW